MDVDSGPGEPPASRTLRTHMATISYASREHEEHQDPEGPALDDEALEALTRQVRAVFSPPAAPRDFDLDRIREFLELVSKLAVDAGIDDQAELEALLSHAASLYVARSVQDHLSDVFRLTFELPAPPVTRGAAAFFRRFAER